MAALTVLALPACGDSGQAHDRPDRPADAPDRTVHRPDWQVEFVVGGTSEDTLLLDPHALAADERGVTVLDIGGGRLLRFSAREGRLRWTYGRKGHGPDEFSRPMDLEVDGAGRSWVLDTDNRRITVVRRDGTPLRRLGLRRTGTVPDAFVPSPDLGALLISTDDGTEIVELAPDGEEVGRTPFPAPDVARMDPISAQMATVNVPGSTLWVSAMSLGGRFFVVDGSGEDVRARWYAEAVSPPNVAVRTSRDDRSTRRVTRLTDRDPFLAEQSLAVDGDRLYVLFEGRTEHARRVVDVYGLPDGEYVESLLLPGPAEDIAVSGETLYATHNSPFPTLVALTRTTP